MLLGVAEVSFNHCDGDCDACVDKLNCPDSPSFVDPRETELNDEEDWEDYI